MAKSPLSARKVLRSATTLFVTILLALCSLNAAGSAGPMPTPREAVRVVLDDNYPPYIFRDSGGSLKGILVDQWALWEKKTGIHVRLEAMGWAEAQQRMEAGDYDVIDTIFVNEQRKALYDFSAPYVRIDVPLFFSRELSGIAGPKDLAGFIVGAKRGDNSVEILKSSGVSNFLLFDNYEALVTAARDGKIKVFTIDKPPAMYFLIKMGIQDQFRESEPLYSGEFHRAVHKGDIALLADIQRGFNAISRSEYEDIERRWHGSPLITKARLAIAAIIAGVSGGIICLLLLWVWMLRRNVRQQTAELRTDIAMRKKAEEKLHESKNQISRLLQTTDQGIYGIDMDGRCTFINRAGLRILDHQLEDCVGKNMHHLIHHSHSDGLPYPMEDCPVSHAKLTGVGVQVGSEVLWRRDGTSFPAEYSSYPILESGEIEGAVITFSDISERKKAEQALQESEARMSAISDAAQDAILLMDQNGYISYWNPAATRIFGYTYAEAIGKNLHQLIVPSRYFDEHHAGFTGFQISGQGPAIDATFALEACHKNGHEIFVEVSISALHFQGGWHSVGIIRDISERKQAEEALRVSEEKFAKIFQMSPDAIDLTRISDGVSQALNHSYSKLYGYTHEEVLGHSTLPGDLGCWVNKEDRDRHIALLKEQGEVLGFEAPARRKDGSTFIVQVSSSVIEIDGEVYNLSITRDITEHKALQEELEKSKNLLQQVLDTLPIPVYCKDQEERYNLTNRAFQRFMGRTENDVLGKTSFDISPPHLGEIYCQSDRLLLETGKTLQYETMVEAASGLRQIVVTKNVMRNPNGDMTGVVGAFLDITERKQAVDALRASHDLFSKAFTTSPDSININRLEDGVFVAINEGFTKITGYTEKDLLGRSSINLWVDPLDRKRLVTGLKATGEVTGHEAPFRMKDGSQIIGLMSAKVVEIDGKLNILSITRDITERKRARETLRVSEEKYRRLVSDMQVGVLVQGPQTEILLSNPKALELLGLSKDQLLGKTSFDLHWNVIHENGSPFPEPTHPVPQAIATRQAVRKTIMGVYRPVTDDRVWLSVDAEPQLNDDGTVLQVVCTLIDITERKQAEDERRKIEERMGQAQKLEALGVLVAGVAHNINNVLAAIMATASLREMLATETRDLDAYKIIGKACTRGRDVVKALTQFAQPTLSNQAPLELHALITEVCVLLESTTRNRIKIMKAFAGEPFWIQGDVGRINHALMNLCLNALDAMPNGGTLTFRTAIPERNWVEVSVEDSGEGMTPAILARATEPFFTTKEVGKGTGLGLSMTHGVIKAHGGTLVISSTRGQGTTVRLRFPRIPAPTLKQVLETPTPSLAPLKVLLVDDDELVRELVIQMLEAVGLQVEAAVGGEEALESLRNGSIPDLVILDQNMPRMNGIQTMEKIRALHSDMPILISSGQPDIEEWFCFKQPNVAVITKPFKMDELLAKLTQISQKSQPQRNGYPG